VDVDDHAGAKTSGWFGQDLPGPVDCPSEEQHLDTPSGLLPGALHPGGTDPGLIDHDEVPWFEEVGQLEKPVVTHVPGVEEAGGVAGFDCLLCDRLFGEVIVEVGNLQSSVPWGFSGAVSPMCS